jgi:hypothetical protein
MSIPRSVFVVTWEVESGSVQGFTYTIEAVYLTEKAASDHVAAERAKHEFGSDDEDSNDDWCTCHGFGWSYSEEPIRKRVD